MGFMKDWTSALNRVNAQGIDDTWATRDEVGFILGLGSHCEGAHSSLREWRIRDRKTLLRQYIRAANNRVEWGAVDKEACVTMAATLLADGEV